jgi:very-short-patch-repair endonuclease
MRWCWMGEGDRPRWCIVWSGGGGSLSHRGECCALDQNWERVGVRVRSPHGSRFRSMDSKPEPRLPMIAFARKLRRDSTDAERKLWRSLRDRRLKQFKFRRQHPLEPYVLDFFSAELRLGFELDGGGHATPEQRAHDARRDAFLAERGIEVVRITNFEMLVHTESLLDHLCRVVARREEAVKAARREGLPSPQPSPNLNPGR